MKNDTGFVDTSKLNRWLTVGGIGIGCLLVFIILIASFSSSNAATVTPPTTTPKPASMPTATATITPTPTTTPTPTVEATPTLTVEPTIEPVYHDIEATPRPTPTPWPFGSEYWHVPTQQPEIYTGPDRKVDLQATVESPLEVDRNAHFTMYLKTHDVSTELVDIRFHVTYYNQSHEWEDLGYTTVPLSVFLHVMKPDEAVTILPANSELSRSYNPRVKDVFKLIDDSSAKVYATVYKIQIDLVDNYNGKIVGSCDLGNVHVTRVNDRGERRYDW